MGGEFGLLRCHSWGEEPPRAERKRRGRAAEIWEANMRKALLSITIAGLAAGLLTACTSGPTPEEIKSSGAEPWSADQLKAQLTGNTLYTSGYNGSTKWEWAGVYNADGTATGKSWWDGGGEKGTGIWELVGNQVCSQWDNPNWGDTEKTCWEFYEDGDKTMEIGVSGGQKGDVFEIKIQPGNPYEL